MNNALPGETREQLMARRRAYRIALGNEAGGWQNRVAAERVAYERRKGRGTPKRAAR